MPLTALLTMSLLTVQTVREEDEVMMRDCSGKEEKKGNSSFLPLPPLRYLTTKEYTKARMAFVSLQSGNRALQRKDRANFDQ